MEIIQNKPDVSSQSVTLNFSFLVVGLARNCGSSLEHEIITLSSSIKSKKPLHWLVIESDSTDDTINHLISLSDKIDNFKFHSLGNLLPNHPKRTERIAYCRNHYIEIIKTDETYKEIDYIVVADLDGVNNELTQSRFESCWTRDDWDMCSANQNGPYYDIWALRHAIWNPGDCWEQYKFYTKYRRDKIKNLYASVHSKMIEIPPTSEWIKVESSFGGLSIYKKDLFVKGKYVGLTENQEEVCEHVSFNKHLCMLGARMFINPMLINTSITEHTAKIIK
jgi:glycosyltransferase involved in cell wall biosynthesis